MTSSTGAHQYGASREHDAEYEASRKRYLRVPVEPLELHTGPGRGPGGPAAETYRAMARSSGPMRNLGEVFTGWERLLAAEDQVAWLTIAGAYVPFGLGATVRGMVEHRLIDVLTTTPAQLTHDLTATMGHRFYRGYEEVDDNVLTELDVNRYWNTFGDEHELNANAEPTFAFLETLDAGRPYTSSEFFYRFGSWLTQSGTKRAEGILTACAAAGVPIFCPSPGDADMAAEIALYRKRTGRAILLDPAKEVMDMVALNAAIEDAGARAGIITLGGGAPRNYAQQAMACAFILERSDLRRYNYGLRISLDPVHTGGLSGSSVSEGKTWKKYSDDTVIAEYFGDFMAPLYQMAQALVDERAGQPKRDPVRVRYGDDGRMLVTVGETEADVQEAYDYR